MVSYLIESLDSLSLQKEREELINKNGFDERYGISCLIANTEKGKSFCNELDDYLEKVESKYSKIAKRNKQLNKPSERSPKRDNIMNIYAEKGYEGIEALYRKKYRKQRIVHFVYNKIPRSIRNVIKKYKDQ